MSPRNPLRSPTRRPHIQIADRKWAIEAETSPTRGTSPTTGKKTETGLIEIPGDEHNEPMSEYELKRIRNIQENEKYLRRLFSLANPSARETSRNHEKQPKVSRNNCGIHTIFYIMGNCRSGIKLSMSPSQIETHSIQIRARLIKMIVEGLHEGMSWAQSLKVHIRRSMEVNKWF